MEKGWWIRVDPQKRSFGDWLILLYAGTCATGFASSSPRVTLN